MNLNLERFYETFVARDLFAKVVPGAVLLITILWWLKGGDKAAVDSIIQFVDKMPGWAWLFLYGACYALGFAIQGFGELVGIPVPPSRRRARWAFFTLLSQHPPDETYETFQQRMIDFDRTINDPVRRSARERLVVIKEMAGNVSLSSSLSFVIWIFAYGICEVLSDLKLLLLVIIVFAGVTSLYMFHIYIRWYQREFESTTMHPARPIREYPVTVRAGVVASVLWVFLVLIVFLYSERYFPFATGTNQKAFYQTTFGMSPQEVSRANGQPLLNPKYRKSKKTCFPPFAVLSPDDPLSDETAWKLTALGTEQFTLWSSWAFANYEFIDEQLYAVHVCLEAYGEEKDALKLREVVIDHLAKSYKPVQGKPILSPERFGIPKEWLGFENEYAEVFVWIEKGDFGQAIQLVTTSKELIRKLIAQKEEMNKEAF